MVGFITCILLGLTSFLMLLQSNLKSKNRKINVPIRSRGQSTKRVMLKYTVPETPLTLPYYGRDSGAETCKLKIYNVSEFIAKYYSKPEEERHAFDLFIEELDNKVKICRQDLKYKRIYDWIDTVVQRVCEQLSEQHLHFLDIRHFLTGSILSGTKVGLPHEADYILRIPDHKMFASDLHEQFYKIVYHLVHSKSSRVNLTLNIPGLEIVGVRKIKNFGATLFMTVCENEEIAQTVGVTVDLVLAFRMTPRMLKGSPIASKISIPHKYMFGESVFAEHVASGNIYLLPSSYSEKGDSEFIHTCKDYNEYTHNRLFIADTGVLRINLCVSFLKVDYVHSE